jgi:hypothetical protein
MTAMNAFVRSLLASALLLGAVGCVGAGPASSARSGCYDQAPSGSQGYDTRPLLFLFCRQNP